MKIASVRPAGFRGFLKDIRIPVPSGFLVVCGPNGSGKTSLCDAVEFALTGDIQWRQGETERRESISDYYWWKGQGEPEERYVELALRFSNEDEYDRYVKGREEDREDQGAPASVEIGFRRTAEDTTSRGYPEVLQRLTDQDRAPDEAIERLCRTSIIRDEEITELSIELAERDRYRFVVDAVGSTEIPSFMDKAESVEERLSEQREQRKKTYGERKEEVQRLIQERSETKAQIEDTEAVNQAIQALRNALDASQNEYDDTDELLEDARRRVSKLRSEGEELRRLQGRFQEARDVLDSEEEISRKEQEYEERLEKARLAVREGEEALEDVEETIASVQEDEPRLTSLAELHRHGENIGLKAGGRCPLCDSEITEDEFVAHLDKLARRVAGQKNKLEELRQQKKELENTVENYSGRASAIENEYEDWRKEIREARDIIESIEEQLVQYGGKEEWEVDAGKFRKMRDEKQGTISSLLSWIETVEASQAADRLAEIEKELEVAREKLAESERMYERADSAVQDIQSTRKAFDRIQGDVVDERLAAISPVLEEMFVRLKPHVDWREVSYRLRGDVRRFLSLEVGDEYNPRFLFSSGQRRASGLAFLFAVHLSAGWSNLDTLILDDPVQHIDDYRALHLVEVLTALRKAGRQIICTVEDRELANLLCRRLNTGGEAGGLLHLDYVPGGGIEVEDFREIGPVDERIFESAM